MQNYAARLAGWPSRAGLLPARPTFVAAFSSTPALAQALPPAKALKLPELKYEKYTMPNGLVVITHEDHRLPLVAVDLWYHVGPLNERAGRTGFAHLFEHMMFEGSEHVGEKAHIKFVQGAGATDVNGTTSFDRTNYFETMPSNQLELALWLESDRMGFLMEGLDRVKLANQRDVVRNERRQGEGRPYNVADEEIYHLLFPKSASVLRLRHRLARGHRSGPHRRHPRLPPAVLHAQQRLHRHRRRLRSRAVEGAAHKILRTHPSRPQGRTRHRCRRRPSLRRSAPPSPIPSSFRSLRIAFLAPAAYTPGDADTRCRLLRPRRSARPAVSTRSSSTSSRSRRPSVAATMPSKLTSIIECDITAKPGIKLEDLEATFWSEVAKLQADGPTQEEVDSARTIQLTRKITGLQRLGGFGGVADTLDTYNQYTGDPGYLPKDIARYQAATIATVKQAAAKFLNKNQAVVVSCIPGKKVVDDVPRSPADTDADVKLTAPYSADFETKQNWRKTVPAAGPSLAFHLPVPSTFTLE